MVLRVFTPMIQKVKVGNAFKSQFVFAQCNHTKKTVTIRTLSLCNQHRQSYLLCPVQVQNNLSSTLCLMNLHDKLRSFSHVESMNLSIALWRDIVRQSLLMDRLVVVKLTL